MMGCRIAVALLGDVARAALYAGVLASALPAWAADSLSPVQKEAVRTVLKEYLQEHPELVVEALQASQRKQEAQLRERQKLSLTALKERLEADPDSPVWGNPKGNVTLVDFSDYNCPFCKRMYPTVEEVVAKDGNVRVVVKELPILGPESLTAARYALAARKQGKYAELRNALMLLPSRPDEKTVQEAARRLKIDVDQLKRDLSAPEVERELRKNQELAEALGIGGTPAFVIGGNLIGGAVGRDVLETRIATARQGKKR